MYRNVTLSLELEWIDRARRDRRRTLVDNAADTEFDAVLELGARLFFNPAGGAELYGNAPARADLGTQRRTSWDGQPVSDNDPAVLVRRLEATHLGTAWLIEQFQSLRDQLDSPGFWLPHERFKCLRLLCRQPVHCVDDVRVATVFVASHALRPAAKHAFIELLSDMDETQLKRHRKRVQARFPDLFRDQGQPEYKQMLVDLLDENIDRLSELLREHEASAEENAERTVDRFQFDSTPEGTALSNHLMRCTDRLHRGFETYRKYQSSKRRRRRADEGESDGDDAGPLAEMQRSGRAARDAGDQSRIRSRSQRDDSYDEPGDDDMPYDDSYDWSDLEDLSGPEITPRLPIEHDFGIDDPALIAEEKPEQQSAGPRTEADDHRISWLDEIGRNLTNEPGTIEPTGRTKQFGGIDVAPNFGASAGLDNCHLAEKIRPPDAGTRADAPPRDVHPTCGRAGERARAVTRAEPRGRVAPGNARLRDPAQAGLPERGDPIESRSEEAIAKLQLDEGPSRGSSARLSPTQILKSLGLIPP
jgi:hypothetical protein